MYPLISIYLIIPIVSPWLEKASAKEERIFLGLFALSTFIPWIHRFITDELIETPLLEWSWEFCTPNVLLATFGLFLVFSCIRRKAAPGLVTALSKGSFGMYLMHLLFLAPIAGLVIGGDPASPFLPVWLAIPLIAVLTFACCAVTTSLLSRIPGSKWVIGC